MTLTFKLWFIDEETDDANAFNITRDIAAGELFPRVGDSVSFDSPEIKDMPFVVSDVQYKYHADGTLDDILITGESDEYYNRRRLALDDWLGEDEYVDTDLGELEGDDLDGFGELDGFENEFGNDPDDNFEDDGPDDVITNNMDIFPDSVVSNRVNMWPKDSGEDITKFQL